MRLGPHSYIFLFVLPATGDLGGDGAWAPSGAPLTNGTGTVSWDLPLDGLSRFYRVQAH